MKKELTTESNSQLTKQDQLVRRMCLLDELETSSELIKSGFGHLQEIDVGNTFYALPHQLIASGLERLMKSYISLVHKSRSGSYPDKKSMRCLGHDLSALLEKIRIEYFGGTRRPIVASDLEFISTDSVLVKCLRILSIFGMKGRYYNLDVVSTGQGEHIDPKHEWKNLETVVEDPIPYINDDHALYRVYYPRVHCQIISKLERLVRAIVMQLTLGDHQDTCGDLKMSAIPFYHFLRLQDSKFGTIDYRRSVEILKVRKDNWTQQSEADIFNSKWPTRQISKTSFKGEWPFRHDQVIIELRNKLFAIVHVEGYAFALNGSAKGHLKYPDPHDAGIAILGRSIGPFIEIAWGLLND